MKRLVHRQLEGELGNKPNPERKLDEGGRVRWRSTRGYRDRKANELGRRLTSIPRALMARRRSARAAVLRGHCLKRGAPDILIKKKKKGKEKRGKKKLGCPSSRHQKQESDLQFADNAKHASNCTRSAHASSCKPERKKKSGGNRAKVGSGRNRLLDDDNMAGKAISHQSGAAGHDQPSPPPDYESLTDRE